MTTTNYNIRIDQNLRDRAFSVFESYGLAPAQAIKLFLHQVADTRTIPLSFTHNANSKTYSEATRKSLIDARKEFETAKAYNSLEDMMRDIEKS
ncbi:type II toxin-antitoxin system RelB/DinJ family antitoxin [Suttonella indologenes]|uniref:Antitoxin RelB n=1 Tax=Suttonella indologenes TaxID=13276 RepID=A0A380MJ92_9GAMM|nr:type II toxin-antitoxin system RelB/DinJ family antitoxin [Suttonella indologenes]SUO91837.1 Antitoxin RelB [Suttonella indologenes]